MTYFEVKKASIELFLCKIIKMKVFIMWSFSNCFQQRFFYFGKCIFQVYSLLVHSLSATIHILVKLIHGLQFDHTEM